MLAIILLIFMIFIIIQTIRIYKYKNQVKNLNNEITELKNKITYQNKKESEYVRDIYKGYIVERKDIDKKIH